MFSDIERAYLNALQDEYEADRRATEANHVRQHAENAWRIAVIEMEQKLHES